MCNAPAVIFFNPYADRQTKGASRRIEFLSRLLERANVRHTTILAEEYRQAHKGVLEKLFLACGLRRAAFFLHAHRLCSNRANTVISEVIFTPTWLPNMVLTVHDLKTYDSRASRGGMVRRMAYLVFTRLARQIVVVSESVRSDMMSLCGIQNSKIHVVPNGISQAHLELAASFHGQSKRYDFIYVSSFVRHKRHAMLLRAAPVGSRICLIGRDMGALAEIRAEAARRADDIDVEILEDVTTDARLFELLGQSRCGVFPSVFEGFGIPILEYGASGLHVIASDIPPFRELGAYIDRFVKPDDEADLRAAMAAALDLEFSPPATKAQAVSDGPYSESGIEKRLLGLLARFPGHKPDATL